MKKKLSNANLIKCLLIVITALLSISSCKKGSPIINLPLVGPNQEFYALVGNSLKKFNAKNIKSEISSVNIIGLANAENVLSIDFRPATGELYAVTDQSKLYIINVATGAARPATNIATGTTNAIAFNPAINGTAVSLNFNPTVDRIRLISNIGQNLRINPETGTVAFTDGSINGVNGAIISGAAYTNNIAGASTTVLFDIDLTTKKLYKQDPPNNGTLVEIGSLGVDIGTQVSFDISPDNKIALASGATATATNLYTINLNTGLATLVGNFPSGVLVKSIAIPTSPIAYAVDNENNFLIFNPQSQTAPISKSISGLQANETIVGLDMRPYNGQLYALGNTSRLYTVNIGTGVFTQVGTLPFATLLAGNSFGFDFNPTVDRIRVVSNTGQNLRLHPETGIVAAVDVALTPGTPTVSAAAYSNNFVGATATKLYVIDHNTDKLYIQDANAGVLTEIGALGVNVEATNGFDIISTTTGDTAYAIFTVAGSNKLYTINLTTGVATAVSDFSKTITAFTLGLRN